VSDRAARAEAQKEEVIESDHPLPRPTVAVGAFVFDGDRVLLVERGQPPGEGLWTVPGGRQEPGETLAQAVAREVREETGLVVEVGPLACVVERIGPDHHFVILDYVARCIGGTLVPATDARAARFVDEAELASLPLTEGLTDALTRARAIRRPW
jgi:ADP-ribose pyrophosphatase YjhB (NUDIX family)